MSKNIVIQEAGLNKSLTVDALRLKKFDGGSEDWTPEDGKNLVELQIGGSGTYRASDYNAYGIAVARVKPKYGGGATSKAAPVHEFATLHNIAIKEGDKTLIFSASELKVNNQGGGTSLWVPKDDVGLKTKYITKSGTYPASADECYGFSEVTVSGVDVEITQDEDGDDVAEITDGGETREEKLPSEIRIEREPYFTGPYGDRAYISFDGLVVHGYSASGVDLGAIPFNELVFPVTVTDISQVEGGYERDVTGTILNAPVYLGALGVGMFFGNLVVKEVAGGVYGICIRQGPNYHFALASYSQGSVVIARDDGSFPERYFSSTVFHYQDKTCYIGSANIVGFEPRTSIPISTDQPVDAATAAGIALLGTTALGGGQRIPVQWNRPYDERMLESSFMVEVVDVGPNVNDGN